MKGSNKILPFIAVICLVVCSTITVSERFLVGSRAGAALAMAPLPIFITFPCQAIRESVFPSLSLVLYTN
jgi:hypothetical protein